MEQQDGKNILEMEKFLTSLEKIVNQFQKQVESINRQLSSQGELLLELEGKINALDKKLDSQSEKIIISFRNELIALREGNDDARNKTAEELKQAIADIRALIVGRTEAPHWLDMSDEENK